MTDSASGNFDEVLYDERNLLAESRAGANDPTNSLILRYSYDDNGNLTALRSNDRLFDPIDSPVPH